MEKRYEYKTIHTALLCSYKLKEGNKTAGNM